MSLSMTNLQADRLLVKLEQLERQKNLLYKSLKDYSIKSDEEYKAFYDSVQCLNKEIDAVKAEITKLTRIPTTFYMDEILEREESSLKSQKKATSSLEKEIIDGNNFHELEKMIRKSDYFDGVEAKTQDELMAKSRKSSRNERERIVKKNKYISSRQKLDYKEADKAKKIDRFTLKRSDFELESPEYIELINLTSSLEKKKSTPRYKRATTRYVEYLYQKKELEDSLKQLEIQKNLLYASLEDYGLSNDKELDTFTSTIQKINDEIAAIKERIATIESKPLMKYIDEIISEELRLLELRRIEGISVDRDKKVLSKKKN